MLILAGLVLIGTIVALILRSVRAPRPVQIVRIMRKPAPLWGPAARRDLQTAVRIALAPAAESSWGRSLVVIGEQGQNLYDDRANSTVIPASTQKLIIADAALTALGPQYRFHTYLSALQPPQNGAVPGNIYLIGSGDPSLRSHDLQIAAQKLARSGVARVDGAVVADASALQGPELNPHWNPADANEDFMVAISGVSVDEDTVEFRIAGQAAGTPASVRTKPQSAAVRYGGSVQSGDADDVIVAATGTPNFFQLSGGIPPGVRQIFYLPVHGIARYAAELMTRFLRDAGVIVAQTPQAGRAPAGVHPLWDHPSPLMSQLVHHMLIFSDNHFAEQFLRVLGGLNGKPTDAGGLAAEMHTLKAQRVPAAGLHLVDGSGLADENRVSAMTLAGVLHQFDQDPRGNLLYPLLARGGLDGTLRWYHFHEARGRVRAKSGHLSAAASLAGYIETRHHGRVAFAFLFNGPTEVADRAIVAAVDQIARR